MINAVCVGDTVNKRWAGGRNYYLRIHSPDGAFSVILFRGTVYLWP